MGLGAKRRSKEPGAQAQLNVYPHLRSLGPVAVTPMRVPQGRSKIVFEEDNSIGFAGLAIFFPAGGTSSRSVSRTFGNSIDSSGNIVQ